MAKRQAQRAQSGNETRRSPQSTPPAGIERNLGARDETYDIISVLYHTLQGADTIAHSIDAVARGGNEEVRVFLEETRSEYVARARAAKELLASLLEGEQGASVEEEEEDEDDE